MLRAIIYDLDGTLIDSRADLAAAVNAALAALALPMLPLARVTGFVGGGAELLVRRSLAAARGAEETPGAVPGELVDRALPLWHESYAAHLLDQTRLYPGLGELVAVQTIPQAVLTNKPGRYARRILDGLGLAGRFAEVVGGDEAPRKPDPRGLLDLCAALGVAPAEALLVGDSPIDLQTGKAAAVPACAVAWGYAAREALQAARPEEWAETPAELAAIVSRR